MPNWFFQILVVLIALYPTFGLAQQQDSVGGHAESTADTPAKPLPPIPKKNTLANQQQVYIRQIKFDGNSVFDDERLQTLAAPYQDRTISSQELQDLRMAVTQFYIDNGYINSGAIVPDQVVNDGVVTIKIIEGQLDDIQISGNDWLQQSYIENRLKLGNEDVLNIDSLQKRIQMLQQDRLVNRVNAQLVPGLNRGQSKLKVDIQESKPYEFGISFNNWRAPSIGGFQAELYGGIYNLTGYGDALSGRFRLTDGFNDGNIYYSIPFTAYDSRVAAYFDRSDTQISQATFSQLNIRSATETIGFSLSHPFYRTPQSEFLAEIIFEKRRSKTFLFGRPFSFVAGPQNGVADVSVLRLAQQWIDRSAINVIAIRSVFSIGLDLWNATKNAGNRPDGQFFAWRGQFQWVRRLDEKGSQFLFRTEVQLAADSLLPMEKFAVGGATTVRGYRQNLLVRDNGVVASVEFRVPVFRLPLPYISVGQQDGFVQIATFFDFGWSHNTDIATFEPTTIASPGLGLRWDPSPQLHSELYWGIPLRKVNIAGEHDIQDSGIHFLVNLRLL